MDGRPGAGAVADPLFRLFGGKGGAGKTTVAAATALARAETGRRVLLVSTDPAHSLGDALATRLGARPRRVRTRRGLLRAVELDAERALARWTATRREALSTIVARGTFLDRAEIDGLLRLALPGADEVVGLMEVERLARAGGYDEVVVDTAPTGHTLRLLAAPLALGSLAAVLDRMLAKHRYMAERLRGGYRADAADALVAELDATARAELARLRDGRRARVTWVMLPEHLSARETEDAIVALRALGIAVDDVVVNQRTAAGGCRRCGARENAERAVLRALPAALRSLTRNLDRLPREPRGLRDLRGLARDLPAARRGLGSTPPAPRSPASTAPRARRAGAPEWLSRLAPAGTRLVIVLGKGGVGKTTCAATVGILAARAAAGGVLVLSTDPAHSLGDALDHPVGDRPTRVPGAPAGLRAREMDAGAAYRAWRERHRAALDALGGEAGGRAGVTLAFDRAVMRDLLELAPPGLDEIFGVLETMDAVSSVERHPRYRLVVVDAAPTGHALRMLAMPETALAWTRTLLGLLLRYRRVLRLGELAGELVALARRLERFRRLLRDGEATRVVVVTRPGRLPREETVRLVSRLGRMHLGASALIVNAAADGSGSSGCARCRRDSAMGRREVDAIRRARGRRLLAPVLLRAPAWTRPPRGAADLETWGRSWEQIVG